MTLLTSQLEDLDDLRSLDTEGSGTITPLRRHHGVLSVQGSLALDLEPLLDPPPVRVLPGRPGSDVVAVGGARRARVASFVVRYLQGAVEIAAGDRPAAQLLRHTDAEVFADLSRRGMLVTRSKNAHPGAPQAVRPVVRGVRTSFVSAEALEACARVDHGPRSRAVAARFEIVRDRWQCVALEFA